MQDQNYYARKKLADALYALSGFGTIQERLTSAAECLLLLQQDDLTQKPDWAALREVLMKTPLRDHLPRAVEETEAVMLARQIVDLYIAFVELP